MQRVLLLSLFALAVPVAVGCAADGDAGDMGADSGNGDGDVDGPGEDGGDLVCSARLIQHDGDAGSEIPVDADGAMLGDSGRMRALDLDGDGRDEVAMVQPERMLVMDVAGGETLDAEQLLTPEGILDAEVVDLDGDGREELIVAGDDFIRRLWIDEEGSVQAEDVAEPSIGPGMPWQVSVADINDDGALDLLAGSTHRPDGAAAGVYVALGNGDGTLGEYAPIGLDLTLVEGSGGTGFQIQRLETVRTSSGDTEIWSMLEAFLTEGTTQPKFIWRVPVSADGTARPEESDVWAITGDAHVAELIPGDDTMVPVLPTNTSPMKLEWMDVSTQPASLELLDTGLPGVERPALGDLNGDGYPDLIAIMSAWAGSNEGYRIIYGGPEGPADTEVLDVSSGTATQVAIGDVDGDGEPEAMILVGDCQQL